MFYSWGYIGLFGVCFWLSLHHIPCIWMGIYIFNFPNPERMRIAANPRRDMAEPCSSDSDDEKSDEAVYKNHRRNLKLRRYHVRVQEPPYIWRGCCGKRRRRSQRRDKLRRDSSPRDTGSSSDGCKPTDRDEENEAHPRPEEEDEPVRMSSTIPKQRFSKQQKCRRGKVKKSPKRGGPGQGRKWIRGMVNGQHNLNHVKTTWTFVTPRYDQGDYQTLAPRPRLPWLAIFIMTLISCSCTFVVSILLSILLGVTGIARTERQYIETQEQQDTARFISIGMPFDLSRFLGWMRR